MKYITDVVGTCVFGVSNGDVGPSALATIPLALSSVPIHALRLESSGQVVDARTKTTFFVDANGLTHTEPGDGRAELSCAWNEALVQDEFGMWRAKTPSELIAPSIRRECSRRINGIYKDEVTQRNMAAHATRLTRYESAGTISAQDQAVLDLMESGLDWITSMLATCRSLIAAADGDYAEDAKWPSAPSGLSDLAGQF